jgi:hypothetical protein
MLKMVSCADLNGLDHVSISFADFQDNFKVAISRDRKYPA